MGWVGGGRAASLGARGGMLGLMWPLGLTGLPGLNCLPCGGWGG